MISTVNFRFTISSRALAACMRIDSYFNKNLVPDVTLAMEIASVNISLYNDFDKSAVRKMPDALKRYTCDSLLPEKLCFLTFTLDGLRAYLAAWNLEAAIFDISTSVKCTVVDYAFLTQQNLLEPSAVKLEVGVSKEVSVSAISKPIRFNVSPSIGHTLAVGAQMWKQRHEEGTDLVVVTRLVVCNDTNVNLRFGQASTDEDILLPPRRCHLYAWRTQKLGQMLRVAVEENGWAWSRGFLVADEGSELCRLGSDGKVAVVVAVEPLSATQKRVTFAGQLVICNMLQENFECKVVPDVKRDREKEFKKATSHVVARRCSPPSLLVDTEKSHHLRIRFFGLESTWSGDIPLMENAKCAQPWLVKG